jgi:hypothetical protein
MPTSPSQGIELNLKYIDPSYLIRSVPANPFDSVYSLTTDAQRRSRSDVRPHGNGRRPLARPVRACPDSTGDSRTQSGRPQRRPVDVGSGINWATAVLRVEPTFPGLSRWHGHGVAAPTSPGGTDFCIAADSAGPAWGCIISPGQQASDKERHDRYLRFLQLDRQNRNIFTSP